MLLAVMLLVTVMLIALSVELPRMAQQIKREKEEELIHRGKEYAMAIKRYYHATQVSHNTYPSTLEQLESANNLRFLRRRFKDPMTADGEWKLVHFGEAEIKLGPPGGAPGATGSLATSPLGGSVTPTPTPSAFQATPSPSPSPGLSGPSGSPPGPGGQLGALATTGSPVQAGGAIIGVASKSKNTSIKEFNGSAEYDEWLFVYDPRLECQPAQAAAAGPNCQGNGITIASPRSPNSPPGNPAGPAASGSPTPFQPAVTPAPPPPGRSQ